MQAARAALALSKKYHSVEAVYSRDLTRTLETADIIAQILAVPVIPDSRLRELHQGQWEGQRYVDIGPPYQQFLDDPFRHTPPGGETLTRLARRVRAVLSEIAAKHPDGNVAVVSHELPVAVAICIARRRAVYNWDRLAHENGEIVAIRWPKNLSVIFTPTVARRRRVRRIRYGLLYPYRRARHTARAFTVLGRHRARRTRQKTARVLGRLWRVRPR